MTPNKEVVMNIVKYGKCHIDFSLVLIFLVFKSARFRELFILGSNPGLLVPETPYHFPANCSLAEKCHFFEELSWFIFA